MAKMVLTHTWLRANARHKRADILTMSDLQSQNLSVQIARSGRTTFLWRGRTEGKSQTIIGNRLIADVSADDLGAVVADFVKKHPNGGGATVFMRRSRGCGAGWRFIPPAGKPRA